MYETDDAVHHMKQDSDRYAKDMAISMVSHVSQCVEDKVFEKQCSLRPGDTCGFNAYDVCISHTCAY